MSDLISKEKLLESLIHCSGLGRKSFEAVIKTINEQPPIEPVHGEWRDGASWMFYVYRCSVCNYATALGKTSFCPHCGADMRKK